MFPKRRADAGRRVRGAPRQRRQHRLARRRRLGPRRAAPEGRRGCGGRGVGYVLVHPPGIFLRPGYV